MPNANISFKVGVGLSVAPDAAHTATPAILSARLQRSRDTTSEKKPTWWHTLRDATTSVYSLTNPPAVPRCPSASHPTNSTQ